MRYHPVAMQILFRRAAFVFGLAAVIALVIWLSGGSQSAFLGGFERPFQQALSRGEYGLAIALLFAAGLATSLTPCVYPMITITVSVFGARQAMTRWQGALLSSAFVFGIVALFAPLGLLVAISGGVFGALLAHPAVLLGLAILFVLLAASMFGAFDIALPSTLQNRLARVGGMGYRGAFALGMVSALIAAPCTGPVLGFLLPWIGTSGNVVFGALGLGVYALGLGLLFWVVGTFAVSLPKSGAWLEWVKSGFGIIMLVAALYYVRDVIPPLRHVVDKTPMWLATAVGLVVLGIALGAVDLSFHAPSLSTRMRKAIAITAVVGGLYGLVAYLEALPPGAKIHWLEDLPKARAMAQQQGRPLMVDFGASWCVACGELDRHTFSDARVVQEARRFVAVRVDLSQGKITEARQQWLNDYNQRGLPLVVLHDASGSEAGRITNFVDANTMLRAMQGVR
ncbi:MAG: thioredoxin family protein [Myxococcales bacterium]|nr:thioredoxin family protein [Myxococcales bacterium]